MHNPDEAAAIEAAASQRCLADGEVVERVQQFLHAKSKSRSDVASAAPVDRT